MNDSCRHLLVGLSMVLGNVFYWRAGVRKDNGFEFLSAVLAFDFDVTCFCFGRFMATARTCQPGVSFGTSVHPRPLIDADRLLAD